MPRDRKKVPAGNIKRRENPKWIFLELGNWYGEIFICTEGKLLDSNGYITKEHQLKFIEGQKVKVRFPTGQIETAIIKMVNQVSAFGEHGHPSIDVITPMPHVNLNVNGMQISLPLYKLEIMLEESEV